MMTVQLDKEKVAELFETLTHQAEVLEALYRMVFPDWDEIVAVKGYPKVNDRTWKRICRFFQDFDGKHHRECMPGGAWLNQGFSGFDAESLKDWEVSLDGVRVRYSGESAEVPYVRPREVARC